MIKTSSFLLLFLVLFSCAEQKKTRKEEAVVPSKYETFDDFISTYDLNKEYDHYFLVCNFMCKGCAETILVSLDSLNELGLIDGESLFIYETRVSHYRELVGFGTHIISSLKMERSGLDPVNILLVNNSGDKYLDSVLMKQSGAELLEILSLN